MFSKDFLSEKATYELDKINEIEQRISRIDLIYKTGTKKKDKNISKFKTIRCFGREIYSGILTLDDALKEQISLKDEIGKFKESTKPKTQDKKKIKNWLLETFWKQNICSVKLDTRKRTSRYAASNS